MEKNSSDMIFNINKRGIRTIRSRSMRDGLLGKSLEDGLQTLFEEYPEILPGYQIAAGEVDVPRFALLRREMPVGSSWSLDHLYVDQYGVLTLVETKLAQNPESRREVIGQIIEYAANSRSSWSVANVRERAAEYWGRKGLKIDAVLEERLGPDIDIDLLWDEVGTQLDQGNIRLIIASDQIRPEVRRMIEYLNSEMRHAQVLGLELNCYAEDDDSLIIAPRLIGQSIQTADVKPSGRRETQWNEARIRKAYEEIENHGLVRRLIAVLDWAIDKDVAMYSTSINPSFGIKGKANIRIFSVYSDGQVYVTLNEPRFESHESDRQQLLDDLKSMTLLDTSLQLENVASGRILAKRLDEMDDSEFELLIELFRKYSGP